MWDVGVGLFLLALTVDLLQLLLGLLKLRLSHFCGALICR
jgi:hypothetical protein